MRGTEEVVGVGVMRTGTFFLGWGAADPLSERQGGIVWRAVLPGECPLMMGMFQADPGALEDLIYD